MRQGKYINNALELPLLDIEDSTDADHMKDLDAKADQDGQAITIGEQIYVIHTLVFLKTGMKAVHNFFAA